MDLTQKVLVTGATGMLGTHVMLQLISCGYAVRALVRQGSSKAEVENVFAFYGRSADLEKIEWAEGDVCDIDSLVEAMNNVSAVYNCAAIVSFDKRDHAAMWQTNVGGTANVVEACIRCNVDALCHASSIGALGHTSDGSDIDETTPYQSDSRRSVYSQSKFRQEMEVWRGIERGLNATIVCPGVILGPSRLDRSSGQIVATVQRGISYYIKGHTGYVDVRDVAQAMVSLVEGKHFGQRYVVVGSNADALEIQTLIAKDLGCQAPSKEAKPWMLRVVSRLLAMASFFTGKRQPLTPESVRSMGGNHNYTSAKIVAATAMNFISIEESISNMSRYATFKR